MERISRHPAQRERRIIQVKTGVFNKQTANKATIALPDSSAGGWGTKSGGSSSAEATEKQMKYRTTSAMNFGTRRTSSFAFISVS